MKKKPTKKAATKKKSEKIITPIAPVIEADTDEDNDDKVSEEERADDENRKLMHLLSKPEELLDVVETYKDDDEVVTVCPTCRMEGVFVDNTCPNCGAKKRTKGGNMDRYDDEDVFAKADDLYVNSDDE